MSTDVLELGDLNGELFTVKVNGRDYREKCERKRKSFKQDIVGGQTNRQSTSMKNHSHHNDVP